ncbi:hypothetical protein ACIBTV_29495 [Micromonospora sp. NPDC049366]|uniref:hypothetical protein n=1 Tax=Micromonospora sp. NPDC049366 TaxID=3364271 RepID=UPI0037B1BF52
MAARETPEHIMRTRMVSDEAILTNRVDLRGYPYRLLSVVVSRGVGAELVTRALMVAEMLEATGWQLVTIVEIGGSRTVHAAVAAPSQSGRIARPKPCSASPAPSSSKPTTNSRSSAPATPPKPAWPRSAPPKKAPPANPSPPDQTRCQPDNNAEN